MRHLEGLIMSYDLLVNPSARENPLTVAQRIVAEHEQDFESVETLLTASQWRLLKLAGAGRYHLWALSISDPLNNLMQELSYNLRDAAEIPPEWLDDREPEEVFAGLRQNFAELTPDQCRAIWTILAVAQGRQLQVHQIITEQWWRLRSPHK